MNVERRPMKKIHDYLCSYRTSSFDNIGVGIHKQDIFSLTCDAYYGWREEGILT